MGYTRQGAAIGLAMLAITKMEKFNVGNYLFLIILAALFHKSVVILLPFAFFGATRIRMLSILCVIILSVIVFFTLMIDQYNYISQNYVDIERESSGAVVRVIMNAIPAALFIFLKNIFYLNKKMNSFWYWMSWSSLLLVPLAVLYPSSTVIDRVALYWIPLQMFIYSRLPDIFGIPGRRNPLWVILISIYSAAVMLIWLFFGTFSADWLPYRFYLWEVL